MSGLRLVKDGVEVARVLGFDTEETVDGAELPTLPQEVPALCRFTVPLHAPVQSGKAVYELVFPGGARCPIRICQVLLRMEGSRPNRRVVTAELAVKN